MNIITYHLLIVLYCFYVIWQLSW